MTDTCGTCKFYLDDGSTIQGRYRLIPPRVMAITPSAMGNVYEPGPYNAVELDTGFTTQWPNVLTGELCGNWVTL
jgi:hypothetical protein